MLELRAPLLVPLRGIQTGSGMTAYKMVGSYTKVTGIEVAGLGCMV